ncbi:MAG: hypothetical protein R2713_06535 [Ilumatobacteraceae bacterium]
MLAGLAVAERPASTRLRQQASPRIARAAALRPDYLLLDEPTSGMSSAESARGWWGHVRRRRRSAPACW